MRGGDHGNVFSGAKKKGPTLQVRFGNEIMGEQAATDKKHVHYVQASNSGDPCSVFDDVLLSLLAS